MDNGIRTTGDGIRNMDKDSVIVVENVVKEFGDRRVLDSVSFEVRRGEVMVVMGGSGCGKSTLLRTIIGSIKPDSGKIYLFGKDVTNLNQNEMDEIRKKYGMLFQSAALFDSMTVGENIMLPLREHTKLDENIMKIMVKMKLELVGLSGFENFMPSQLSGGMKKRVGLARAIAMDPQIVFYDEPTAGLDPVVSGVIDKLIMDLGNKLSITSVVVTHDMNSVFRIADRVVMLYQGKVVASGASAEIKNSDNPIVKQFIAGSPDGPISFMKSGDTYLEELTKPA